MTAKIIAPFLGRHDHGLCLDEAMGIAERTCALKGLRFTRIRKQVLSLIWQSHQPQRAYDILEGLKELGHRPAPPTAYRALEFLEQAGLVHRIESLNAYVGCADPNTIHSSQFYICNACDAVAEIHDTAFMDHVAENARELGFIADAQTIEIHGLCARCAARGARDARVKS